VDAAGGGHVIAKASEGDDVDQELVHLVDEVERDGLARVGLNMRQHLLGELDRLPGEDWAQGAKGGDLEGRVAQGPCGFPRPVLPMVRGDQTVAHESSNCLENVGLGKVLPIEKVKARKSESQKKTKTSTTSFSSLFSSLIFFQFPLTLPE